MSSKVKTDDENKASGESVSDRLAGKISVCLLTYNHVDVVESTLMSILDQSITGYEVIVSDDCSTDGTWERILELAKAHGKIKPVRTPGNLGMAGNANFAAAQSVRPYIALLHHDDLYRRDLLEKWASVMERFPDTTFVFNPYDVVNAELHYGKKLVCERLEGRYFLEQHLFRQWGCPVRGTAMIRRAAWDQVGGMREQFNLLADVDMWMRLSQIGAVGYVPEPVIAPRHHRPDYYPDIYTGKQWHWQRLVYLLKIHAVNHIDYYDNNTFCGTLKLWRFRTRLSIETAKWLAYAIVRRRGYMIATCADSATPYDQAWLRLFRHMVRISAKPFIGNSVAS